ncbi:MAG: hypothetical protein ACR2LC_11585 [Pyrinomonadaceae bacterium]
MNELDQKRWAVKSERGRETSGVTYTEAAQLVRELSKQKIHGLCIITNEAAQRLAPTPNP